MTAVEWLINEIWNNPDSKLNKELFNKAKEMEKQQIIESGNSCALKQYLHNDKINKMTESELKKFDEEEHLTFGEEYYNETFKK